jgi:DNA repair and recombination RAD54-like protein
MICSYEVLYYKRKNKVHTSKGVCKLDGILVVDPGTGKMILKAKTNDNKNDDTDAMMESNTKRQQQHTSVITSVVNKEIAKKTFQEDETIVLGGYEVQIGDVAATRQNPSSNSENVASVTVTAAAVAGQQMNKSKGFHGSIVKKQQVPLKRRKLQPLHSVSARTVVAPAALLSQQQPPVPAAKAVLPHKTSTPFVADAPTHQAFESDKQTLLKKQHPLKRKALVSTRVCKPPPTTTTLSTSLVPPPPLVVSRQQQQPTTTTTASTASSSSILPHIPMPVTLAQTLRPHQVVGVDFVWAALGSHKGAIVADEMGLGKTLLTIAVVAALHRQHRDKVRQYVSKNTVLYYGLALKNGSDALLLHFLLLQNTAIYYCMSVIAGC